MATGYTQLADIVRVTSGNIRFSDSISVLSVGQNNTGSIALTLAGITMDTAYKGLGRRILLKFENAGDLTEYNIYVEREQRAGTIVLVAVGNTAVDSTAAGYLTVLAAGWVGAALLGDEIIIETDSMMSSADGEAFINDREAWIDNKLRELVFITVAETTIPAGLYYVLNPPVPRALYTAVTYYAAYDMMQSIFRNSKSFVRKSGKEEDNSKPISYSYKKVADQALKTWIDQQIAQLGLNTPIVFGDRPIFEGKGIEDVAVGMLTPEQDGDYTEYDEELDAIAVVNDEFYRDQ